MLKKLLILASSVTLMMAVASAATASSPGKSDQGLRLAQQTVSDGPLPRVFLQANDWIYSDDGMSGSAQITLMAKVDDNGNSAPRSWFLLLKNQNTGEVRYVSDEGILDAGVMEDIFGNPASSPAMVAVTDNMPGPGGERDIQLLGPGGIVTGALNASDLDTANYQFVLDLREGSGSRTVAFGDFGFAKVEALVPVTQAVIGEATWTSNNAYLINDVGIFVGDIDNTTQGAVTGTLTIEPGTFVLGTGQNSFLTVTETGRLIAEGTAARPIVFTSTALPGEGERAQWGGLILNGQAPINTDRAEGEGGTGGFGGNDPEHSSGSLRYVRVQFAGIEFSPDNELNGIAFQGTGSGTKVDYVQVIYNKDDGMEFFGGTTKAKHIVLASNGDDNVDWVLGWQGCVQFVCVVQKGDDADQGIEADNLSRDNAATPISNPTIYNATFMGDPTTDFGTESDIGVLLREGTEGHLYNMIVSGFKESGVNIDNADTQTHAENGELVLANSIFFNNCAGDAGNCDPDPLGINQFSDDTESVEAPDGSTVPDGVDTGFTRSFVTAAGAWNRIVDPLLRDPHWIWNPDFRPNLNSPALNQNYVRIPPDNGFFDTSVNYIGCMSPTYDWTRGWTYFGQ